MAKKKSTKSSSRNRRGRPPAGTPQQRDAARVEPGTDARTTGSNAAAHRAAAPVSPAVATGAGTGGPAATATDSTASTAGATAYPPQRPWSRWTRRPADRPGARRHTSDEWTCALAAAVVALALYALTAARSPITGDNPDFLVAAHELGVPHAPGYPIATVLGHLTGLLPGPHAWGLNLAAALMGALTVALVVLTACLLGAHPWLAAVGGLLYAVNPLVWEYFIQLEAFSFAAAATAAIAYALVRWRLYPQRSTWLLVAAACFGVGMACHQNLSLLVPAILWLAATDYRRLVLTPWITTRTLLLAVLCWLLPYTYVLWAARRDPVMNWADARTVGRLGELIGREGYTDVTFGSSGLGTAPERMWWFVGSFGLPGVLLLLGLVWAWRHRRWWFGFALVGVLAWLVALLFLNGAISTYGRFVLSRFFLQWHALLAPALALGLQQLAELVVDRRPRLARAAVPLVAGAALVATLALGGWHYPAADLSRDDVAARLGRDLLRSTPKHGVLLIAGDEATLPTLFEQQVDGLRPDVTVVVTPLLAVDWYVDNLRRRHPDLQIPGTNFAGPEGTTFRQLFDANPTRAFVVVGGLSVNGEEDSSLGGHYYLAPQGLGQVAVPQQTDLDLLTVVDVNRALFSQFQPPTRAQIRSREVSFEPVILERYTSAMLNIARQLDDARQTGVADEWYRRVVAIDPKNATARAGLAR